MPNSLSQETIDGISKFFSHKEKVLAVYLLGSAARGELRMDSDVDLAILPIGGLKISSLELFDLVGELGFQFRYDFDLGVMGSENLVYSKEAIFHGIAIYVRDEIETKKRVNTLLSMYYNFIEERKVIVDAYRI
jgi:predicted nucleotidyltransferase